ncbi:DUF4956 domain-containing protein [Cellulomonas sp. ATA003]|uniref:DUF4956 domain-containing protein n=1 Tax=Cellulomonas sp. ATA003 TaxID=3073064 RepID=UPI002873B750|nr:DUF4956 domain-containing protein [Cellulomonas sp. ATA003]WNB85624.1 DUF4956 domain-containing protein [Cellulomonas sp. ATA003]
MTTAAPLALDIVAITLLTFALYFPRHRRRDLVVALLGVNVGVLAVSVALSSGTIGAGLGLGLFGVLSIIRLRSTELGQHEVAYYFSALALGLVGGLAATPLWLTASLMALVLVALWVGDHPRLLTRHRSRLVNLDVAITDDTALVAELERRLGARVHAAHVVKVDLVLETTLVEVRYEVPRGGAAPAPAPALTGRPGTPADAARSATPGTTHDATVGTTTGALR